MSALGPSDLFWVWHILRKRWTPGLSCVSVQASRAVTETNARMISGKPIYVTLAQRKDVRKAQLEQQYSHSPRVGPTDMMGPPVRGGPPLPGMFPQQPPFNPQFYAGAGPMGPPGARPSGPPMGQMYPPMMPRGMPGVSIQSSLPDAFLVADT